MHRPKPLNARTPDPSRGLLKLPAYQSPNSCELAKRLHAELFGCFHNIPARHDFGSTELEGEVKTSNKYGIRT